MLKYKDYEVKISGKSDNEVMNNNKVYISDDKYIDNNVNDNAVARENDRVYVEFWDEELIFKGETYDRKEEIKQFAEKFNGKAEFDDINKVWKIKTYEIDSDENFFNILEAVMKKFDYSKATRIEINKYL